MTDGWSTGSPTTLSCGHWPTICAPSGGATGRREGAFVGHATPALLEREAISPAAAVQRMGVEQSNTSVVIDESLMLKGYRRVARGPQPELEIARFLDRVGYRNTPALFGYLEYEEPGHETMALAILQQFALNQGDAWSVALTYLDRFFDRQRSMEVPQQLEAPAVAGAENRTDVDPHEIILQRARTLGVRTAELHRAFATSTGDPAFEPEATSTGDVRRLGRAGTPNRGARARRAGARSASACRRTLRSQVRSAAGRPQRAVGALRSVCGPTGTDQDPLSWRLSSRSGLVVADDF